MTARLVKSNFVTAGSRVERPFYVIVSQNMIGNGDTCLDLTEGDIFICTYYNKIGYWWGVSVYDLQRQGWFPSTFVQPYTGEVPEEAAGFVTQLQMDRVDDLIASNRDVTDVEAGNPQKDFNIVTDDSHKYQEYEVTGTFSRRGRRTNLTDQPEEEDRIEKEDFDYDAWAEARNASNSLDSSKKSRKNLIYYVHARHYYRIKFFHGSGRIQ